ncbi:MAG: hypothetical protein V1707_02880 [bacterium]
MRFLEKPVSKFLLSVLALEYLSFVAYFVPELRPVIFIVVIFIMVIIAWKNFPFALQLMLLELAIGGKGYLLFIDAGSFRLGLRLGLFLLLWLVWLVKIFKEGLGQSFKRWRLEWREQWIWRMMAIVAVFIVIGVVNGLLSGNSVKDVFLDSNAFLYLGLGIILADRIPVSQRASWVGEFKDLLLVALTVMLVKNLALLYVFSRHLSGWTGGLYKWVRDTGVGEITRVSNSFYRVFFQSQFYAVVGWCLGQAGIMRSWRETLLESIRQSSKDWYLSIISLTIIVLSLSRSFWVGTAVVFGLLVLTIGVRIGIKKMFQYIGVTMVLALAINGFLMFFTEYRNPYALPGSPVTDRFVLDEAANSRMRLLKPLWQKVSEQWLAGAGFGTTVTYQTKDPRIVEKYPDGWYTTYAFEWGHLDLWLKLGLFGWLVVLAVLLGTAVRLWNREDGISKGLSLAIIALLAIHVFTPYINHPLGIGVLLLSWLLFQWQPKFAKVDI